LFGINNPLVFVESDSTCRVLTLSIIISSFKKPWYDKLVFEIFSNPRYYFGWLAIIMIPLGIIAIIATFILITDSLDEGKASSGDKKRSKHSKKDK